MVYCLKLLSLYQRTPLHVAAKEGYVYTVEGLIKRRADINIRDHAGVSVSNQA